MPRLGAGRSSRFLQRLGYAVTGVDISAEMLARARARASDPQDDYRLVETGDLSGLQAGAVHYGAANRCLSQALEIEPGMRPACLRLAYAFALSGDPERAAAELERALELESENLVEGYCPESHTSWPLRHKFAAPGIAPFRPKVADA